jgi:hypothetical protein
MEENENKQEPVKIEALIRDAEDTLAQDTGDKLVALFELDIAKCQTQKARLLAEVARIDLIIASNVEGIKDVKRRMCGVDYPVPPAKAEAAEAPEAAPQGE